MKERLLLCMFLFCSVLTFAQKIENNKSAKIILFRIESINPGINEREVILPLAQRLSSLFRFSEVALVPTENIQWKNENPFNKLKKLTNSELDFTSPGNSEVLLKIEIEHRYNQVLGGLIKKGRRHVMRLKIAMFTSSGHKVWYQKGKSSCCIDLGVSEEDIYMNQDMEASEFLDLYKSVLDKTFAKFK